MKKILFYATALLMYATFALCVAGMFMNLSFGDYFLVLVCVIYGVAILFFAPAILKEMREFIENFSLQETEDE